MKKQVNNHPYLYDQQHVQFILKDVFGIDKWSEQGIFANNGFNWQDLQIIWDTAIKIGKNYFAPADKIGDINGVSFITGTINRIIVPQEFKTAIEEFYKAGLFLTLVNPEDGGLGLPETEDMIFTEIFAGAGMAVNMFTELSLGAFKMLVKFACPEIKQMFLPKLLTGEWGATMCLTEPQAGSDVGAVKTEAELQADGTYKITGGKIFISCADGVYQNVLHPVMARIKGSPEGTKGLSLILVPFFLANDEGKFVKSNNVNIAKSEHKLGIKGSPTCAINFDGSTGYLIGEINQGFKYMLIMMNYARLFVAMQACAVSNCSYQYAIQYAKERKQFGTEIINFPDIKRMLANMKAMAEGFRLLIFWTTYWKDLATLTTNEDEKEKYLYFYETLIPIAKAYTSNFGVNVVIEAMQVLGGYGYSAEYPIEQYLRDIKITSLYEGTNGIQAMDLLGRKMSKMNKNKEILLFPLFFQELGKICQQMKKNNQIDQKYVSLIQKQLTNIWALTGDLPKMKQDVALLHATPILEMLGHIIIATLHLKCMGTANKLLIELMREKNIFFNETNQINFITENELAKFYHNQFQSGAWFIETILPQAELILTGLKNPPSSALNLLF